MSLGRLGLQYRDLLDVIQGDDRYAREIILYHFNDYRVKGEEYA